MQPTTRPKPTAGRLRKEICAARKTRHATKVVLDQRATVAVKSWPAKNGRGRRAHLGSWTKLSFLCWRLNMQAAEQANQRATSTAAGCGGSDHPRHRAAQPPEVRFVNALLSAPYPTKRASCWRPIAGLQPQLLSGARLARRFAEDGRADAADQLLLIIEQAQKLWDACGSGDCAPTRLHYRQRRRPAPHHPFASRNIDRKRLRAYPKTQFRGNSVLAECPAMETANLMRSTIVRVPDEMWERTEPLLPPMFPSRKAVVLATTTGQMMDNIFYVLRTGIQWKAWLDTSELGVASMIGFKSGGRPVCFVHVGGWADGVRPCQRDRVGMASDGWCDDQSSVGRQHRRQPYGSR